MNVFITGITGTIGTALAVDYLNRGHSVYGCARNEATLVRWAETNRWDRTKLACCPAETMTFDLMRPIPDLLIHCAAMKHVDVCEENPREATIQNVMVASRVAEVCALKKIRGVFIGTDKAVGPVTGVYGATKMLMERVVLARGMSVIRLGNVIGSSGSVFERWKKAYEEFGTIRLTDPDCTRFFCTLEEAVAGVVTVGTIPRPGLRYVFPRAVRMGDVADRILGILGAVSGVERTGLRPGETLHQFMSDEVSSETAPRWDIDELLKEAGIQ